MSPSTSASRERRIAASQIGALVASVLVWWWAETHGLKVVALAVLTAAWVAWFVLLGRRRPGQWRAWGLRTDNAGRAARAHGAIAATLLAAMAAWAWHQGRPLLPDPTPVLAVYPMWALAQQFVLQNVVVDGARRLGVPTAWLPLVAGVAFGTAHLPDIPLAALTASAAVVWTIAYLRWPNLWILALHHSVVGAFAFYWLLGRDPADEFPGLAAWAG